MFVGPPFHAMPFVRHVDYGASSIFINLTDTRKWFGKERAQHHLNPRTQEKHKGKDGAKATSSKETIPLLTIPPTCAWQLSSALCRRAKKRRHVQAVHACVVHVPRMGRLR